MQWAQVWSVVWELRSHMLQLARVPQLLSPHTTTREAQHLAQGKKEKKKKCDLKYTLVEKKKVWRIVVTLD